MISGNYATPAEWFLSTRNPGRLSRYPEEINKKQFTGQLDGQQGTGDI